MELPTGQRSTAKKQAFTQLLKDQRELSQLDKAHKETWELTDRDQKLNLDENSREGEKDIDFWMEGLLTFTRQF